MSSTGITVYGKIPLLTNTITMTQVASLPVDIAFDMEVPKLATVRRQTLATEHFLAVARRVFESHGAVNMSSPDLLPAGRDSPYRDIDQVVKVMTRGGDVVTLPYDLRVSWAR